MEFTIPAPLGAQASLLANTPARKPPDSTKIEAAPDTGKPRADMHNSKRHGDDIPAQIVSSHALTEVEIDPDMLAGPPPSFQVNVLEMDQKLQQKLARLETERARARHTENPVATPSSPESAKAEPGATDQSADAENN